MSSVLKKVRRQASDRKRAIKQLAAAKRVSALYRDALTIIAHHPNPTGLAAYLQQKAREALDKTNAAEQGSIYGHIK